LFYFICIFFNFVKNSISHGFKILLCNDTQTKSSGIFMYKSQCFWITHIQNRAAMMHIVFFILIILTCKKNKTNESLFTETKLNEKQAQSVHRSGWAIYVTFIEDFGLNLTLKRRWGSNIVHAFSYICGNDTHYIFSCQHFKSEINIMTLVWPWKLGQSHKRTLTKFFVYISIMT
jgi:hypothetical protein